MTETEKKKYEAILRIAYLLAAADGDVKPDEREAFKRTLKAIDGFEFGEPSTTSFIEGVVEDGKKLALLRDFYSEDEMIKAFMEKIAKDVVELRDDKLFLRRAFAVWTSICLADKDFSAYEEKIVKGLQSAYNGLSSAVISGLAIGGIGAAVMGLLGPVAAIPAGVAVLLGKMALSPKKEYGADACISDDYLAEVRSRCIAIDDLQRQIDECKHEDAKVSMTESLHYLVESMKNFVNNVEA